MRASHFCPLFWYIIILCCLVSWDTRKSKYFISSYIYTKETYREKQCHYSNLFISILSSSPSLSSNALTASSVKIVFLRCKIVYTFKAANKHTKRTVSNWPVKTETYVEKRGKLIVWLKRFMLIHKPKL